ncbi:isocitrate/isopropylmalate dehydrogenase family protein [Effusibacillus dendaii]|uniref:isocitrate/isopropylmalate dehydrogenase family protein n=1 Tax=Effusibacillus dendaii TaxID=2743772 RepID=UPI001909BD12|nr:isocitrate/isopropylmalate dehydrogenase family protein [Effusibacillus dendaii]
MYKIGVMEGDGIGPEVVKASIEVLRALERKLGILLFTFIPLPIGLSAFEKMGSTCPDKAMKILADCDGAVLGPVSTHAYQPDRNMPNPSARIRKQFDLYANLRPVRSIPGYSKFPDVDLLIVRENTEGMYADRNLFSGNGEWMIDADTVLSVRVVTRHASERVGRMAFQMARERNGKKHVAVIHKANVLRKGCGLFLEECRKVKESFADIQLDDFHIDAFAMQLILQPETYDVIVTTNMFGDILSDEAAGLVGGLGIAPGLNAGDSFAVAQATHGSAPSIAGQNLANPIAEILSAKMLLHWLGITHHDGSLTEAASILDQAVWGVLADGQVRTPDLGGCSTTQDMTDAIVSRIFATNR